MGPNTPENKSGEAQNQEQIKFQQFYNEFARILSKQLIEIEKDPNKSQEQKDQEKADLSTQQISDLRDKLTILERVKKLQQDESVNTGLSRWHDKKAQAILNAFEGTTDVEQIGRIAEKLGPYITGVKNILIEPGKERSEFLKDIDLILGNYLVNFLRFFFCSRTQLLRFE